MSCLGSPTMTGKTVPLYIVCSPSRCVGKTLVSRLLIEFYLVDDRPVAAFDLADEGPQLADYLPDITTISDIGDTCGQMAFFDRLLADSQGAKVIDVSHRTFKNFFSVVQEIRFFQEARHRFIEPLILFIIDPDPKSVKAYATLRDTFKDACLLPVRNRIECGRDDPMWRRAPGTEFPASLDIPLLGLSLRALIDRQSFSFSQLWSAKPTNLPFPLDEELWGWIECVFIQFRNLELSLRVEAPSTRVIASRRFRTTDRQQQPVAQSLPRYSQPCPESAAVDQSSIDLPEQVLKFAPEKYRRFDSDRMDQSGNAILAELQKAARQLWAAEDRIGQLEKEVEYLRDRAVRAEMWLQLIQKEIEEKLISPAAR
jgi:hypothetical protein